MAQSIELRINDMSTLMGHFVLSPREKEEKKDRDWGERKMNESEEIEEIKTFLLYPYLLQG